MFLLKAADVPVMAPAAPESILVVPLVVSAPAAFSPILAA
jgi:hypothetical protein